MFKSRESEVYDIMFTMFDQAYADEMTKKEARAEGEARGVIKMCRSLKMGVDEIVEKLVDMLGMSQTQAREAALMYA